MLLFRREAAAHLLRDRLRSLEARVCAAVGYCQGGACLAPLNPPLESSHQIHPWRDGAMACRQASAASRTIGRRPAPVQQGMVFVLNRGPSRCGDDGPRFRARPVAGTVRADRTGAPPLSAMRELSRSRRPGRRDGQRPPSISHLSRLGIPVIR